MVLRERTNWLARLAGTRPAERAATAVILLSLLPMLLLHFRRLWLYEHYRHFPFVIAAFVFLVWTRWPKDPARVEPLPKIEFTLFSLAAIFFVAALAIWSSWLAAVGAISALGAVICHTGGRRVIRPILPAWMLLWLLIPLPFRWDVELIFHLQTIASNAASDMLDSLGVSHYLAGHILRIPGHDFLVEEACSGIQSLFVSISVAAIASVLLRRPWFHAVAFLLSAVFWATSVNVVRVTSLVAAFVKLQLDLSEGMNHEILGIVLFGLVLIALLCTDRLLLFVFSSPRFHGILLGDGHDHDIEIGEVSGNSKPGANQIAEQPEQTTSPDDRPLRLQSLVAFACIFGLLGTMQMAGVFLRLDALAVVGQASEKLEGAFQASTLAQEIDGWHQVRFVSKTRKITNSRGNSYSAWTYRTENATAIVQINYPLLGFHWLTNCYKAEGWLTESIDTIPIQRSDGTEIDVWCLSLYRTTGDELLVRFSQFDSQGRPVRPGWKTTRHHPFGMFSLLSTRTHTYQVLMHVKGGRNLSEEQRDQLTDLFLAFRRRLAETAIRQLNSE